MMCYRDMTFCHRKDCNKFGPCGRSFTEDVHKAAIEWWGSTDYPIALFVGTPDCFEIKPENNTNREEAYAQ